MPWREVCVEQQRQLMVLEALAGRRSKASIAEQYGVTRKTVYKWMERFREGPAGLSDLPRAPRHFARAMSTQVAGEVVRLRLEQPREGPLKIQARLAALHPDWQTPAASTIGDLLRREQLVRARRGKRIWPNPTPGLRPAHEPNEVWAVDFKGWFRTADHQRCDPLTITDLSSRYLLKCQVVKAPDSEHCQPVFEAAFREFGLPRVIRSDNGPPFASTGLGRLSPLAIKWIKSGIRLERIEPGHPEQNGSHERMHNTLKQHTSTPPAANLAEQQQRFDCFREYFNHQRPHQALDQTTPAQHYRTSPRAWREPLEDPWYDADHQVRRVRSNGRIKWRGETIFISETLIGELIGLQQLYWGDWLVSFAYLPLALIEYRTLRLKPLSARLSQAQILRYQECR
jgi:putative transposase